MATVIRGFPAQGVIACYIEAAGGGHPLDYNAPCNAPARDPAVHLDKVIWHPSLFQWEVAFLGDVTVNHTAFAGQVNNYGISLTAPIIGGNTAGVVVQVYGGTRVTDIALASHGAGTIPIAMVAYEGRMLPAGYMIQSEASGALRSVTPWVDGSNVYLRETAISSDVDLPAVSRTYSVVVFRTRNASPSLPLWSGPSPMQLARGVIDSSRRYAKKAAPGDSPFSVNQGPTIDIANGRARTATGGIVVTEPGYNGSLVAPPFASIGV